MITWTLVIYIYLLLIVITFIPVLVAILKKVKLHPGGDSFMESNAFSNENKEKLKQHFTRIYGTLIFWKNKAEWHRRFHYYTTLWTIPISILIPIISQTIDDSSSSKLFLTIASTHVALLLAFHRVLKVENNYKAFRQGESEFYDLYRRLLDRPTVFGGTQEEQIDKYFEEVEKIRRAVRNSETDNFPIVQDNKNTN